MDYLCVSLRMHARLCPATQTPWTKAAAAASLFLSWMGQNVVWRRSSTGRDEAREGAGSLCRGESRGGVSMGLEKSIQILCSALPTLFLSGILQSFHSKALYLFSSTPYSPLSSEKSLLSDSKL